MASIAGASSLPLIRALSSCRQRIIGPKVSSRSNNIAIGAAALLKYGGPTEILLPIASANIGYNVPIKTTPKIVLSKILLPTIAASRLSRLNVLPCTTPPIRNANSAKAPPTYNRSNARINAPRSGSTANACTLVNIPDRTKNVPAIDIANAISASMTVHARNASRVAKTLTEWSKAVAASHGNNDAFSTGSQNHHPPQPSS